MLLLEIQEGIVFLFYYYYLFLILFSLLLLSVVFCIFPVVTKYLRAEPQTLLYSCPPEIPRELSVSPPKPHKNQPGSLLSTHQRAKERGKLCKIT